MKPRFLSLGLMILLFAACEQTSEITGGDIGAVATLTLTVDPETMPADGISQATLRAMARDDEGDPVSNGSLLSFGIASGAGQISQSLVPTVGGIAETNFVAGTVAGGVNLFVTANGVLESAPLVLTTEGTSGLQISAGDMSLLADGESSTLIIAVLTDAAGDPVSAGTEVTFSTTLGELEDVLPTDDSGTASARLRSARFETGTARVSAAAEGFLATIDVSFVSEDAAHIELVGVEPQSIGVQGTGQPEQAFLTFLVTDDNGIPVDSTRAVTVEFEIFPQDNTTDATVYPASMETSDQGRVLATVNAGMFSGVVQVWARSGSIEAGPIPVAIHGGLPDPERFGLLFGRVNVAGSIFSGFVNDVTALAGDKHGNPVPQGTMVWFSTDRGIIEGSDPTDELGRSSVMHVYFGELPPDSLVTVCAQTIPAPEFVAEYGDTIEVCSQVMVSGKTQIVIDEPAVLDVPNAGAVTIKFRVSDSNGYPLTAGTTIEVSASVGNLFGDTSVTLPDTQSSDDTMFEVVLSDDEPDVSEVRNVRVVITVTSQNGNGSASLLGTIN